MLHRYTLGKSSDPASGIVYDASAQLNDNDENTAKSNELPNIIIPGWSGLSLPANSKTANVSLHNPIENEGYYDMSFSLIIRESDIVVFTTGLIRPGEKCSEVTLNEELTAGEYDAILFVQPYLIDEQHTKTNNAELAVRLIVK